MKLLPLVAKVARMKMPRANLKPPKGFKVPNVQKFKEDIERLGEDIAEGFKEQVIENIEENKFGYTLAPSTIQRKGSDIPLIDTHELVDSIVRDGTTVTVEDTPHAKSGLTNLQIAIIQEYGTKDLHIPARPVWRSTFREYKGDARNQIKDFLATQKFKRNK